MCDTFYVINSIHLQKVSESVLKSQSQDPACSVGVSAEPSMHTLMVDIYSIWTSWLPVNASVGYSYL